jgi:hypothetical protein
MSGISVNKDAIVELLSEAGLVNTATLDEATTTLGSRIEDAKDAATGANNAVAGLTTRVANLEDGGYISESTLLSAIENKKDDIATKLSGAGLINTATLNDATTTLGSRITDAENTASDAASAVSTLTTRVKSLEDGEYISESSLVSAIEDNKDEIISRAGLVNTAALNSATSGLVAATTLNDYTKKAEVIATVNNDTSNVKINADKINIDANHQLDLKAQNIKLAADKVTFTNADGTVTDKISIDPTAGTLKATNADLSGKITATNGTIGGWNIDENRIYKRNGSGNNYT